MRARGVATRPTLAKVRAVIGTFSRRRIASHRSVASDPLTVRFGPTFTPTSAAALRALGGCAVRDVFAQVEPDRRLLTRFDASAAAAATPTRAAGGHCAPPR